jgi:hypothetical protein
MSQYRRFLTCWNCNGLETVADITTNSFDRTWQTIAGDVSNIDIPNWTHLRLRAMASPSLHYEIYELNTDLAIKGDDIIKMFSDNPQGSADLIRSIGTCLYSDRMSKPPVIV